MNSAITAWIFATCCGYLWSGSFRGAVWGLLIGTASSLVANYISLSRSS